MSAPRKARAERDAWMQADGVVQAALDRMRQLDQERAELAVVQDAWEAGARVLARWRGTP